MFQKLFSKKWMFLCLLLGSVLLIATVISFPLYQNAVFDRMLRKEFQNYHAQKGEWPARLTMSTSWDVSYHGESIRNAEERLENMGRILGVDTKESIFFYRLRSSLEITSGRRDADTDNLQVACMSGLPQHARMLAGEMYSDTGYTEDGYVEAVINQECTVSNNILVGDILEVNPSKEEGAEIKLLVTGVFRAGENDDYWNVSSHELSNVCLIHEDVFRDRFMSLTEDNKNLIFASQFYLFEYNTLKTSSAEPIINMVARHGYEAPACMTLLQSYQRKRPLITATLLILEVPVLVLLGAFLFMVSSQMYELERNEISVIKSRGSSRGQIFRLYLYQNIFLTLTSALAGIPLGVFFVRILGSTSNFLEFGLRRKLDTHFDSKVLLYLGITMLAALLIMTLPAIRHSKVSIVHLKQQKAAGKRALWERFFLDFICLGISLYGYYNYAKASSRVAENVLSNQSLDPLLYICSSLFIVGLGLLFLRLQPLLVKLVFAVGKRFWKPASYVSFLENQKNGRKQHFIMLFLILTVSLGSFYATVARTILQNALNNLDYLNGTDIIIREVWKDNYGAIQASNAAASVKPDGAPGADAPNYTEPDFFKYSSLDAGSCTKVYYDDPGSDTENVRSYVTIDGKEHNITLMGIHTKEFGEQTWVDRNLTEEHYYASLNKLADNPDGILVSRNFQTQLNCKVGDRILCHYDSYIGTRYNRIILEHPVMLKIAGFIDYWPGYAFTTLQADETGNVFAAPNYLVVANFATLQKTFDTVREPYEVWISLKEGTSSEDVAKWIRDNQVSVKKYVDRQANRQQTLEEPLLQGTNGVLTMSFLVMLLLCAAGYLIYWIMSIRSRELVFGTLRAFGMHKKELFHILMLEQLFSGILSMLAGAGIGILASRMFVPILQTAYAASNQVLPILLYTNPEDMVRLYGTLIFMMAVCLMVLVLLVLKLNVTKALKLGEE